MVNESEVTLTTKSYYLSIYKSYGGFVAGL